MKRLLPLTLLLLAFAVPTQAQTEKQATIYVYRNFYHTTFGKAAPTVEVNDEKYAVLDEGRFFVATVPTGLVVVKCGKKRANRVDIDARPGETYFIRVRAHPGNLFTRFEMFRVTEAEAKADAEKLRYAEAKDIKNEQVKKEGGNFWP